MPWSNAFILGIETIDEQHRWLVEATNRLHDQIESQCPDARIVEEILEGLVEYTMNHFILEEELFHRLGYPDTAAHNEEHNEFTRSAIELLLKFEQGDAVTEDTLEFLQAWLVHHILQVDKAYVPFLKEKGVR
ncbi:MAG: bacteriohemerythrin [Zoogloeaceae bacterium]|jgi:hemerythrin|nr:bacteriohemerythrin [Zoogloeaceae bacterium]